MRKPTWYASNEGEFIHETIDQAIEDLFSQEAGWEVGTEFMVWEGKGNVHKSSFYVPDIIEHMSQNAYEVCADYCYEWPDVPWEAEKELQEAVKNLVDTWAHRHKVEPNFGRVTNIKEHSFIVTEMVECTDDIKYKKIT